MDVVTPIERKTVEIPKKVERTSKDHGAQEEHADKENRNVTSNDRNLIPTSHADNIKLFTSSSLPLHGLYEVMLVDKNKDGRVDAGDAINEYMLIASQAAKEASEDQAHPSVDQIA